MSSIKCVPLLYQATNGWEVVSNFKSQGSIVKDKHGKSYTIFRKEQRIASPAEITIYKILNFLSFGILSASFQNIRNICAKGKETIKFAVPKGVLPAKFFSKRNNPLVSGPSKHAAKNSEIETKPHQKMNTKSTEAQKFKWEAREIQSKYAELLKSETIKIHRTDPKVITMRNPGGTVNVAYLTADSDPSAKVGIMIAANSGLPGGALGKRPGNITSEDLSIPTQEESIWANAVLTACGTSSQKQQNFHADTIQDKWGMNNLNGNSTSTRQGIDFTKTGKASDYNGVYLVNNCSLSLYDSHQGVLVKDEKFPVMFAFADSVNANHRAGTSSGTMQRTLNMKAINDYDFFCECIKEKMRSALDGMASEGVTHPLIARLSCGIYAGNHKDRINNDFEKILRAVLNEPVGPKGEVRGAFFKEVIIPMLG